PVGKRVIRVCTDPACTVAGAEDTLQAACRHAGIQPGMTTADGAYTVERSACLGLCDHAPAALVNEVAVGKVTAGDASSLFTLKDSNIELRVTGAPRMLTRHIGTFSPTDLPRHLISGAFRGQEQALTRMTPEQIIGVIKDSKLVGRGGAAFPTRLKRSEERRVGK